mmetsp:Transcript_6148/g.9879  ORF Transcript_6148/g.9879 Transcript_6148/m.9879 type:complete len:89 (+) Transcript_6148:936-1202(+)
MDEPSQSIVGSYFNVFDAAVMIFSSLFFMFFSREWMSLHSVFIGLVFVSFFVFCCIPESPKFLVQRREYLQANLAYNFICRFNNQPDQ